MMPPSPWLSARRISTTYLSETTTISVQKISDSDAEDVGCVSGMPVAAGEDLLQRVERAGADVAVDDAERGERKRREGRPVPSGLANPVDIGRGGYGMSHVSLLVRWRVSATAAMAAVPLRAIVHCFVGARAGAA